MIVGVDPGLAFCGIAELPDHGAPLLAVYRTSKAKRTTQRDRLAALEDKLAPHVLGADAVIIEAPGFPKGAVAASQLWAVYGLVRGLARHRAHVRVVTTNEWRTALGLAVHTGEDARKQRKEDVCEAMLVRYPRIDWYATIPAKGMRNHAYDALAMATVGKLTRPQWA